MPKKACMPAKKSGKAGAKKAAVTKGNKIENDVKYGKKK